ncbi:ribonuclease HI family protein [Salinibaculum rarum]|uniref:ribonuclease HI family protein n=1 Tax=Salinibaculum rarum TaxID=3058903 RepID=UPI00265D858F|nr:ribonuclease HI family protein [Salinibaculum sp. KK48]
MSHTSNPSNTAEHPSSTQHLNTDANTPAAAQREIPTLYFDGACKNNPGPAAYGYVLYDASGDELTTDSHHFADHATNNEAEYHAIEEGLRTALDAGISELLIRGDSQLVIKQVRGEYDVNAENLTTLCNRVRALIEGFDGVVLDHVTRDNNHRADGLASAALDNVKP